MVSKEKTKQKQMGSTDIQMLDSYLSLLSKQAILSRVTALWYWFQHSEQQITIPNSAALAHNNSMTMLFKGRQKARKCGNI